MPFPLEKMCNSHLLKMNSVVGVFHKIITLTPAQSVKHALLIRRNIRNCSCSYLVLLSQFVLIALLVYDKMCIRDRP